MSSVEINKCHLDLHGEANNSYSSTSWPTTMGVMHGAGENDNAIIPYYDEATKTSPGVVTISSDISGADIGYYQGRHGVGARFLAADFENNSVGYQIGHPDIQSFNPSNASFYGGQFSNNTTAIKIDSGRSVFLDDVDDSGSTNGLVIASGVNPDDVTLGAQNSIDGGITAPNGYRSLDGSSGSRMPINSADMTAQDLTTTSSNGANDYRHHDGSGTPAAGLFRGDGSGGWVRVEDNTKTI